MMRTIFFFLEQYIFQSKTKSNHFFPQNNNSLLRFFSIYLFLSFRSFAEEIVFNVQFCAIQIQLSTENSIPYFMPYCALYAYSCAERHNENEKYFG